MTDTPTAAPQPGAAGGAAPARQRSAANQDQIIGKMLRGAIEGGVAFVRKVDPDAAADLDAVRRRDVTRPSIVVVGETKRGKSSLVNMLVGVPNLSPVDAAVATAAYLDFSYSTTHGARAYLPGHETPMPIGLNDLRDWATVLGQLPDGMRPPRRIEVQHSAPLLRYLTLVDTPGVGGLDSMHAEVALDAVERATALLFVVDAAAPFAQPELSFLIEASKRVNFVLFALTKTDAYPGWRTILADNRGQLQAHAPRFGSAPWFPVSARLAELAMTMGQQQAAAELIRESRVAELQHALVDLAGKGHLVQQANVLRSIRSEIIRMDQEIGERMKATDPDPAEIQRARSERAAVAARKRTESRHWSLALNTETQRARVEATARLRNYITQLQETFMNRIDKGDELKNLPRDVDRALYALSVRLSHDLEFRFRKVGERVLSQVFQPHELHHVLRQLNARLRHALGAKPRREGDSQGAMVVMSSASMVMLGSRAATMGAGALGIGSLAGGLAIPVIGLGLGLAAGAYMIWKRKSMVDKQQARTWLREVLGEARAALSDEIMHRFTDLQYALTLALDEAIERRLQQLDAHIANIDKAMAEDKAVRGKRKSALGAERETLRTRVKQVDEVLVRVRQLVPAAPVEGQE